MKIERQKMLAGALYDPMDRELVTARVRARDLCQSLNATRDAEPEARRRVLPGARIGSRAVIGAGSVVTRNVPEDVFAAGNPCRVIREITQ